MREKKEKSKSDTVGGLVFVGPLMIGIGLGIYFNQTAVGVLVGLGVGFILFGLVKALMKE
ncbi:MAG: hypothetical protein QCI00_02200 [Candidatus Thermoplasmatota archaeon]|nr:hypothetical protein [Candidatus Thermoplasmatota archaeon]